MSLLLPCPFCGSNNLSYEFAGSQGYIRCNECCTEGPCDERAADPYCEPEAAVAAWNRRHDLAQPESQGPTSSDVTELFYRHMGEGSEVGFENAIAEALTRWGRPAIEPVPVSERLPEPEDCDEEGRCWWWNPTMDPDCPNWWSFESTEYIETEPYWLPHWALPVPQQEVE